MVTNFPQTTQLAYATTFSSPVVLSGTIFVSGQSPAGQSYTVFRTDGTPAGTSAIFTTDPSANSMSDLTVSGNSPLLPHIGIERFSKYDRSLEERRYVERHRPRRVDSQRLHLHIRLRHVDRGKRQALLYRR